jgi:hypothetical protein
LLNAKRIGSPRRKPAGGSDAQTKKNSLPRPDGVDTDDK